MADHGTTKADTQGNSLRRSLLLAALLFLLGDKALVLSKLGIHLWDTWLHGEPANVKYVYEISLLGLAIGATCVVVLSALKSSEPEKDNPAILTGLVLATLAVLINLAEAGLLPENEAKYGDIPQRGLFFYILWIGLFLAPSLIRNSLKSPARMVDLSLLLRPCLAFLVALCVSIVVRSIAGHSILSLFHFENVENLGNAIDRLRYNPDTLVILGTVWTIVAFDPWIDRERRDSTTARHIWLAAYLASAFIAGWAYAALISYPDGVGGISADAMAFGYATLSIAPLLAAWLVRNQLHATTAKTKTIYIFSTFGLCALAMFLGLAMSVEATLLQRIGLAAVQGMAGAAIPFSLFVTLRIATWLRR